MNPSFARALEQELQRQAIISFVVIAIIFAVSMWTLYIVIKCAIRDGINESGLTNSWRRIVATSSSEATSSLPDMRAER